LRNENLVSEQLHLVETEIETEGGIETIGLALARRPHPIVPRHIHGQGHEAENLVAARHQEAVLIQIKYDRRAGTVVDGHIPGIEKGSEREKENEKERGNESVREKTRRKQSVR